MHNGLKRAVNHQKGSSGLCGHPPLESRSFTPILSVFVQQLFAWPNTQPHPCLLSLSVCDNFCVNLHSDDLYVFLISLIWGLNGACMLQIFSVFKTVVWPGHPMTELSPVHRGHVTVFLVCKGCPPSFSVQTTTLYFVSNESVCLQRQSSLFLTSVHSQYMCNLSVLDSNWAHMPVHTKSKVFGMKVLW